VHVHPGDIACQLTVGNDIVDGTDNVISVANNGACVDHARVIEPRHSCTNWVQLLYKSVDVDHNVTNFCPVLANYLGSVDVVLKSDLEKYSCFSVPLGLDIDQRYVYVSRILIQSVFHYSK